MIGVPLYRFHVGDYVRVVASVGREAGYALHKHGSIGRVTGRLQTLAGAPLYLVEWLRETTQSVAVEGCKLQALSEVEVLVLEHERTNK